MTFSMGDMKEPAENEFSLMASKAEAGNLKQWWRAALLRSEYVQKKEGTPVTSSLQVQQKASIIGESLSRHLTSPSNRVDLLQTLNMFVLYKSLLPAALEELHDTI